MANPRRSLNDDLEILRKRAFSLYAKCAKILKRFHRSRPKLSRHPHEKLVWGVYDWLLTPYSLWPVNIPGLANHMLDRIASNTPLDDEFLMLLEFLGPTPKQETCESVGDFEHCVAKGNYDRLVRCPQKFNSLEAALGYDSRLTDAWFRLKSLFDPTRYANKGGVIRRKLSEERNFRRNWDFAWTTRKAKFQVLFDAFCYRWQLYGMERDTPLLLKITVNPTPHGTLIMIPRLWSLDCDRDLNWKAIGKLHRSHGAGRQGPKQSTNRIAMYAEALEILKHQADGKSKGLKGERLNSFIFEKMKKAPGTDTSWIKRRKRLLAVS
jgi:hypothetical protein